MKELLFAITFTFAQLPNVCMVKNYFVNGEGSFAQCIQMPGPRIIMFEPGVRDFPKWQKWKEWAQRKRGYRHEASVRSWKIMKSDNEDVWLCGDC